MNARRTPEPRLPSGVVSARPAMTASTALEARKALATCSVAGKADRTLQAPMSPTSAMTTRRRKLNVVRRRAATAGSRSARAALVAIEGVAKREANSDQHGHPDEGGDERLCEVAVHAGGVRRAMRSCLPCLVPGEDLGLGRGVLLVGQRAPRVQVPRARARGELLTSVCAGGAAALRRRARFASRPTSRTSAHARRRRPSDRPCPETRAASASV